MGHLGLGLIGFRRLFWGLFWGTTTEVMSGDNRSFDSCSHDI